MKTQKHSDTIRHAFTLQANKYAANSTLANPARLAHLVETVNPPKHSLVLDVATGPGFVAEAFASVCRMVIGVDITRAPLEIARRHLPAKNISNLHFQLADVGHLPFADAQFNVVVCRLAVHHFNNPARILTEMARVCHVNGTVAIEDIIASEHSSRASYQNRFEKLRDPSHTKAQPLTRLLKLFADTGIEVEKVITDTLLQDVDAWLANAYTPTRRAAKVKALIARDAEEDLSGTDPFRNIDGRLQFRQRTAIVVGRKLR